MSVDLRTRTDGEHPDVDPAELFEHELPERFAHTRRLVAPGAARLGLRPLGIEVGGQCWSLRWDDDALTVRRGPLADGVRVRLGPDDLTGLVHDQYTPMTFYVSGRLDMPAGGLPDLLDWWLVLRGVLDERALHTPGAIRFTDRDGSPLDLGRRFDLDADRDVMAHFLREAGFLHLSGVFTDEEMAEVSRDMDRAAPSYADGDGRSWWVTVAGGARRLVRMQDFDERSAAAAALLDDERVRRIADIAGDGHVHAGPEGNRIEALVKPIGVAQGISDVPWHKDCSLGRHSYECCGLKIGISVTGADAASGQLRVVAGSHRALMRPARVEPGSHDLPEIDLPTRTGDVTVHLSCTLHMAEPPTERERRVMYTGLRLPGVASSVAAEARARIRAAREKSHTTVSQPPAVPARDPLSARS